MSLDFNELRELLAAIAQTDIAELTLKSPDFELTVRKGIRTLTPVDLTAGSIDSLGASALIATSPSAAGVPTSPPPAPEATNRSTAPAPSASSPAVDSKWEEIKSPMVGTFYRAPSPDDPPYVEIGDRIRRGQSVCIIEAMKLMNEIEAEVSGQVMEILVQNGEPVEYGQPLMRIKPEQ